MFNHHSYFSDEQTANFRHFIAKNRQNIDLITSRIMLAMDFKLHMCGLAYLREAIAFCYRLPLGTKVSFNGTVYPFIAQKYNVKARNVERDIRTAIHGCYNSGNMIEFNAICGYEMISAQYLPTNCEFIIRITTWIKTVEMEYDMCR